MAAVEAGATAEVAVNPLLTAAVACAVVRGVRRAMLQMERGDLLNRYRRGASLAGDLQRYAEIEIELGLLDTPSRFPELPRRFDDEFRRHEMHRLARMMDDAPQQATPYV